MEDKLNKFLCRHCVMKMPDLSLTGKLVLALAGAVIDINRLYLDSKHMFHSFTLNISSENDQTLDQVFDSFTSTMGVPFEVYFTGAFNDNRNEIVNRIAQIGSCRSKLNISDHLRDFLPTVSPPLPLKSVPESHHSFAWISDNSCYRSWYNERKPQLLYLSSSFDTKFASEYVFYDLNKLYLKSNRQVVLYFDFDQYDVRRNNVQNMLATLQAHIGGHLSPDNFKFQVQQHRKQRCLHYNDLLYFWGIYRYNGEVEGISCVLNKFDECDPTSRKAFLDHLRRLSRIQEEPVRILVTSRQPRGLVEELAGWPVLDLDQSAPQVNQVFRAKTYEALCRMHWNVRGLRKEVEEEMHAISELDPDLQTLILQHMAEVPDWPSGISFRDVFGPLNAITLELAICKILDVIPDKPLIIQALTLILYAVRPPTIWEVTAMVHFAANDDSLDLYYNTRATNDVRDKLQVWLAGIVTIFQAEAYVSTRRIREALLSELSNTQGSSRLAGCLTPEAAHARIAEYSLRHLSSEMVKAEIEKLYEMSESAGSYLAMLCDRTNILDYAIRFWVRHFALSLNHEASSNEPLRGLVLFSESGIGPLWTIVLWVLSNPLTRSRQPAESLYSVLAGAGMAAQIEDWLEGDQDLSAALVEASFKGSVQTIRSLLPRRRHSVESLQEALLEAGVNGDEAAWLELVVHVYEEYPDFPWNTQRFLVSRASRLGHENVLKKLLEVEYPGQEQGYAHELSIAVKMNHLAIVKILVEHGADPKSLAPDGGTHMHQAAAFGYADMIRLLAEYGVNLNATNNKSFTPIHVACYYAYYDTVETLLSLGADPNIKAAKYQDEPGWSPLTCVITREYTNCAYAILNAEADVNLNILGVDGVPLHYAIDMGLLEICQILLERGVDPNYHPRSPPMLIQAMTAWKSDNRLRITELLINKGADVNEADDLQRTALRWACMLDEPQSTAIVTLLLKHGADVNCQCPKGLTPLHIVVYRSNIELLKVLVASTGVNLNALNNTNSTPLSLAYNNEEAARVLLEAGANPDTHSPGTYSVLVEAVGVGNEKVVRLLVEHGARIDPPDELRDNSLWEPMQLAVIHGKSNILKILADGGGDINRRFENGWSLTQKAIDGEALGALLEFRPDLDARNDYGGGSLNAITRATPLENVKLLVRAGADINLVDQQNITPLMRAVATSNEGAANYLMSKGANPTIVSPNWGSVLHAACREGLVGMVKRFISLKADVNWVSPVGGSPLSCVFDVETPKTAEVQTDILDCLIEAGADVTIPTGLRLGTVGVAAAWGGTEEHIKKLASSGASFSAKDKMGRQPLHLAAVRGDMDIFIAVLNLSDKPDERDNCGRSLISWAAQGGSIDILERALQLIGKKAINEQDMTGWTPLCWAARGVGTHHRKMGDDSQRTMIKTLLKRGADKYIKSLIEGKHYTPECIATYHNHSEEILQLLAPDILSSALPQNADMTADHGGMAGISSDRRRLRYDDYCDFCLADCWGVKYGCTTCNYSAFRLCYKCYVLRHEIHPLDHEFETIRLELEEDDETTSPNCSSPTPSAGGDTSGRSESDAGDGTDDET
ncbi:ankyrin repeat-containing domain protein [Nemania sp. FL0916]|nr:ankyrin repeat-containing domain protein [Nemania sp. FL0916]